MNHLYIFLHLDNRVDYCIVAQTNAIHKVRSHLLNSLSSTQRWT